MPRHRVSGSNALDNARATEVAKGDVTVQCDGGFPWMVHAGDELLIAVPNLVLLVVVVIVLIVLARRLAPCRTPLVVIVLPPFHAIDHV